MRITKGPKKLWLLAVVVVTILVVGWLILGRSQVKKIDHPEYLSFNGSYAFSVPKDMVVDAHAIQGIQLVYSGNITGKNLDGVYSDNNISLQPVDFIKDKNGDAFKKYVNESLVPEQKQKLTADVTAEFSKADGQDVAKVTAKKDGNQLRFIYLRSGKHPVSIVSKEETARFKKIEQTITDIEKTDLKNEAAPLKQAIQNIAQQIRDKKAHDIYTNSDTEFKTKTSEDELTKLLTAEEVYSQGSVTINGGSYGDGQFGAVVYFIPLNSDFKPASGALYFKKVNSQWKLTGLQLPNAAANKRQ